MDQFVTVNLGGDQSRAKHEAEAIPAGSDGDGVEPDVSSQPGEVAFGLCLASVEAAVLMCVCSVSSTSRAVKGLGGIVHVVLQ